MKIARRRPAIGSSRISIHFHVTPSDYKKIVDAAYSTGVSISQLAATSLLSKAEKILTKLTVQQ